MISGSRQAAGGGQGGLFAVKPKDGQSSQPHLQEPLPCPHPRQGWLFSYKYDEKLQSPNSPLALGGCGDCCGVSPRCSGTRPANCLRPAPALQNCFCQSPAPSSRKEPLNRHQGPALGAHRSEGAVAALGNTAFLSRGPPGTFLEGNSPGKPQTHCPPRSPLEIQT